MHCKRDVFNFFVRSRVFWFEVQYADLRHELEKVVLNPLDRTRASEEHFGRSYDRFRISPTRRHLRRTCARDDHSRKVVPDHLQMFREHFSRFQNALSSNFIMRESVIRAFIPISLVVLAASALQAWRFQFFGPFESFLV